MFEKEEAFDFIANFLEIKNGKSRFKTSKRELLDEILFRLQTKIPFQSISLLSVPPNERRKPTQDELKANFISGIGGLCFDICIPTFHLLAAIGYEVAMVHATVSTTTTFHHNHMTLTARNVEREGDWFLLELACGHPTFAAINLDFEKESPIYVNSYIEYKYVWVDGKLNRMQRKGDTLVARGVQENSEIEFWIDGWRKFYAADLSVEIKDPSEFEACHREIFINPASSPFHFSQRLVLFPEGKAAMVINDKTYMDIEGELVVSVIEGGDDAIKSKIKQICPKIPQELLVLSLLHWRQSSKN